MSIINELWLQLGSKQGVSILYFIEILIITHVIEIMNTQVKFTSPGTIRADPVLQTVVQYLSISLLADI